MSFALLMVVILEVSLVESKQIDFLKKQKKFIKELYAKKRYFDCIAETRKLLHYKGDISNIDEFNYFIEGNYFLGEQYKSVISHIKSREDLKIKLPYLILQSQSYLKLGLFKESIDTLKRIDYTEIKENERYNILLRRAEIFIQNSDYKNAISEINTAKAYIHNIDNMWHDVSKYQEINKRAKWLSVTLSAVIPGAGQVYSSRFVDGIISFVSVMASLYGAYHFHQNGDRSLSLTFAFITTVFYAGNVYGAYNSAKRTNKELDYDFRTKLIKKYIPYYNPMDYIDLHRIFE